MSCRPAALMRPVYARISPSKESKRAQGMPGEGLTHGPPANEKAGGSYHRFSQIIRHSLRDGFNGVLRALPGDRAFLPPSSAKRLADLAPASGCQNHTTSPSASGSFVGALTARCDPMRPSHPALNVRDDREAPLLSECGTARIMPLIWGRCQVYF